MMRGFEEGINMKSKDISVVVSQISRNEIAPGELIVSSSPATKRALMRKLDQLNAGRIVRIKKTLKDILATRNKHGGSAIKEIRLLEKNGGSFDTLYSHLHELHAAKAEQIGTIVMILKQLIVSLSDVIQEARKTIGDQYLRHKQMIRNFEEAMCENSVRCNKVNDLATALAKKMIENLGNDDEDIIKCSR